MLFSIISLSMFITQSCIDKSYNWDDMDKNGVFKIPPIFLGSIDTIYLGELPEVVLPEGTPTEGYKLALSDTIAGIFDGDAIKDFFFDGADTIKMEAKTDIYIKKAGNMDIIIYFHVIDYDNQRIPEIVIPRQQLQKGNGEQDKNQPLVIKIEPQYMKYMENAESLELTIVIVADGSPIQIDAKDYVFLKDVIVKTGGYHFEF